MMFSDLAPNGAHAKNPFEHGLGCYFNLFNSVAISHPPGLPEIVWQVSCDDPSKALIRRCGRLLWFGLRHQVNGVMRREVERGRKGHIA